MMAIMKKRYARLFFLVFFYCYYSFVCAATSNYSHPQLIKKDLDTMRALSKHLPILSSTAYYWNTTHPNPCLWGDLRVTCSSSKPFSRVTELDLHSLGLHASMSTDSSSASHFFQLLCRLDALEILYLTYNSFTSIPTSFLYNCTGLSRSLKVLDFYSNMLTGPVSNFTSFHALEELGLSGNALEGQVSSQFDGLARLKVLHLNNNLLNGTIPVYAHLEFLDLSTNYFDGPIPIEFFQSTNLTYLDLSYNKLYGNVPDELGNLSKLEFLDLSFNSLTGTIPATLSAITTIFSFYIDNNFFSGTIPSGTTRYLHFMDLSYNNLSGEIPSDLLSPPKLTNVWLTSNLLQGPIPNKFSQRLEQLVLSNNFLNGTIPSEITQLSNLDTLYLDGNELHGEIPSQLDKCNSLISLNLAENGLQGKLPKELGNLGQLQIMKLQDNDLSGEIPTELFKLVNLKVLNLGHNSLNGKIPPTLFSLKKLSTLNLEGNKLNGSIANTIVNVNSLAELQLGDNKLSGTIPKMPTSLCLTLNLSNNLFSGSIPLYLGNLYQLEILDLSNNRFTGEVPYTLTKMENLTRLVLSNNQLSGTLPLFHNWVTVIVTGNNFIGDNTIANKDRETTGTSIGKQAIFILIVAFVSGFVVAILGAKIIQEMISRCCYQAKKQTRSAATSNSCRPSPLDNFEKMRTRHQVYRANCGETKSRARNSGI